MDYNQLITYLMGAALAALGWFSKTIWELTHKNRSDISALRETIHIVYMPRSDFSEFRQELFTMLHRIEDKLEKKSDKQI